MKNPERKSEDSGEADIAKDPESDANETQQKSANRLICFCHCIQYKTIVEAIESKGCGNIEEIRELTKANTGCGGCEADVLNILKEMLPPDKSSSKKVDP